MYSVSQAFLTKVASGFFDSDDEKITGTITLESGTVINITEDDFAADSLYITGESMDGGELGVGSVNIYEMGFTLIDFSGRVYSLGGAKINLIYQLQTSAGVYENVPLWEFYINPDSISRSGSDVSVIADGSMILFDTDLYSSDELDSDENSIVGGTAYEMLDYICDKCGVLLYNTEAQIESMPNGTTNFEAPETIESCRDCISYICSALGAFAMMKHDNYLRIVPVTATLSDNAMVFNYTIDTDEVGNCGGTTFSDFPVRINAVRGYFGGKKRGVTQESAAKVTRLILDENPIVELAANADCYDFCRNIYHSVHKLTNTKMSCAFIGNIALECGDIVKVTGTAIDNTAGYIVSMITNWRWCYKGTHTIGSVGFTGNGVTASTATSVSKAVNNSNIATSASAPIISVSVNNNFDFSISTNSGTERYIAATE